MSEINLRANRLAVEFEGYVAARATMGGLDPERVHTVAVTDNGMPVEHELTTSKLREAAKLLRERGEGVTLSDEQQLSIRQAVGAMPYGGLTSMRPVRDVDELLRWLDEMRGVLAGVAHRANEADRELQDLRRQRAGARAFLGLDVLDELVETVDSLRVENSGDLG